MKYEYPQPFARNYESLLKQLKAARHAAQDENQAGRPFDFTSPTGVLPDHVVDDQPQNLTIPVGSALRRVKSNKEYLPPIRDAG